MDCAYIFALANSLSVATSTQDSATIMSFAMNLLLLDNSQINGTMARISGRHLEHIQSVQGLKVGDSLRVGKINGLVGTGIIRALDNHCASLALKLDTPPPSPVPITLVLALPRPKMLRRILQTVTSMGIKRLYLIHSARVEKSFWQSPFLSPDAILEQLILGLEQAKDTVLPEISQHKLFKPFVEDQLSAVIGNSRAMVAHPTAAKPCPIGIDQPTTLIVGPEGGFIPYEVDKLATLGVEPVTIGDRILRVETAVPALISRLFPA